MCGGEIQDKLGLGLGWGLEWEEEKDCMGVSAGVGADADAGAGYVDSSKTCSLAVNKDHLDYTIYRTGSV